MNFGNINSIGLSLIVIMGAWLILAPRRLVFLPLLISACFVTLGQVIIIAGANFTLLRVLILCVWVRIVICKELWAVRLNMVDWIFILFIAVSSAAYILRRGDFEGFNNRLGYAYDALGLFFLFRAIIRDLEDCERVFKMIAFIMVPVALAMIIEKFTGRNFFSLFGGVPEFTMMRDGKVRAQGAFMHPILAGTFGATSIPFFVVLWFKENHRHMIPFIGLIAGLVVTITPSSSGPILSLVAVLLGYCLWGLREHMRMVRWTLAILIVTMHLVMNAPVWFLISKLGGLIGGSGYHRSELIDSSIRHFNEWYLLGTDYTRHWMPTGVTWSPDHSDITNQFIRVGIDGGLISLILFISLIVACFKVLGMKLHASKFQPFCTTIVFWSLGVCMFSHLVSFLSVRYFDQTILFWYLLLALIATLAPSPKRHRERDERLPAVS